MGHSAQAWRLSNSADLAVLGFRIVGFIGVAHELQCCSDISCNSNSNAVMVIACMYVYIYIHIYI